MVKFIFLCWRRAEISRERYTELLLQGHVPIALRHHPTMRKYVVNVVERTPPGERDFDSIGELSFDRIEDFHERLYDSAVGEAVVQGDVRRFLAGAAAYVTREHVQKSVGGASSLGQRSAGVKLICPLRRRDGMSHAAFVDHWLTRHVPLALQHHSRMSRYVTNVVEHTLSTQSDDWDGFAELHFPSLEAVRDGLFDSPDAERIVRDDIARFIGHAAAYWVAEYVEKVP